MRRARRLQRRTERSGALDAVGESVEADIWIENIPYNETRNYVQRILWHNVVFSWLKTGEPQKADGLLMPSVPFHRHMSQAEA